MEKDGDRPSPFAIVATSTSVGPSESYRAQVRRSLERFSAGKPVDEAAWTRFVSTIDTVAGDYTKPSVGAEAQAPPPRGPSPVLDPRYAVCGTQRP